MVRIGINQYINNRISYEAVFEARLLLLRAELDAAEKEADRITVLKNFIGVMKQGEAIAQAKFEIAQGKALGVLNFRARRLEAEIQMERAKARKAKGAK